MRFTPLLPVLFGILSQNGTVAASTQLYTSGAELLAAHGPHLHARSSLNRSGCASACRGLQLIFPKQLSYPNSTIYQYEETRYWSAQQASTVPTCRFSPMSAIEVSAAVLLLQLDRCQFAVKSGGHAAFAGASNIQNGVTIDLINLNEIAVSADHTQTSLGPGNRWFDVYSALQPMNLSVIGGRVSDIGVGGFTLGGGISFFSGRYGWACDNVNNYEVVFADGAIRDVNASSFPDLFFALRGGGNNFGIVTRFDVVTFPQGDLWAGSNVYTMGASPAIIDAFSNFNINAPSDSYAAAIVAYAYVQAYDEFIIAGDYQYGKPVVNPPIFQNFTAIPPLSTTMRITNLTGLTLEFNETNPGGFRETYWALTVQNSAPLMTEIVNICVKEIAPVRDAAGLIASCVFQPITTNETSHFTQNGGNALGLSSTDGPLNLINIAISWSDASDDARIFAAAQNIVTQANTTAYSMGLGNQFIYQNYAAQSQDVFDSYGAANKARLVEIHKKYDPKNVWTVLQPGNFKI